MDILHSSIRFMDIQLDLTIYRYQYWSGSSDHCMKEGDLNDIKYFRYFCKGNIKYLWYLCLGNIKYFRYFCKVKMKYLWYFCCLNRKTEQRPGWGAQCSGRLYLGVNSEWPPNVAGNSVAQCVQWIPNVVGHSGPQWPQYPPPLH